MRRTSAVVRAWDGPNSRIAFEMDLDQMPWGPFEALGKKVTVLIPEDTDNEVEVDEGLGTSQFERALRHVEHAAEKCAEFAQLGNGSDQLWSRSLETWEWLRDYLTSHWMEVEGSTEAGTPDDIRPAEPTLPGMPGAAATLEVAAAALRHTPLASWRDVVGTFNPDAPTREEAIRTLLGVAKLLSQAVNSDSEPSPGTDPKHAGGHATEKSPEPPSGAPETDTGPGGNASRGATELSFDYAAGYDEGYQMGRKVGRALGARDRSDPGR